jgi:hypothetical protein
MNESSPFEQRRKGLEEAFFRERDQKLLEKLRHDLQSLNEKQKLAQVSGLNDDQVLAGLVQAGVRAETLTAVGLVPLVEVAWCDGAVSPEERDAVLNAASAQGIHADSAAYSVLKQWLEQPPDPKIAAAWRDYVRALSHELPKPSVASMRDKFMDRAHQVAAAAGGFLGIATVSQKERSKIEELSKAWDG